MRLSRAWCFSLCGDASAQSSFTSSFCSAAARDADACVGMLKICGSLLLRLTAPRHKALTPNAS